MSLFPLAEGVIPNGFRGSGPLGEGLPNGFCEFAVLIWAKPFNRIPDRTNKSANLSGGTGDSDCDGLLHEE